MEVGETGKGKLTAAFVHMVRKYRSGEKLKREDERKGEGKGGRVGGPLVILGSQ